MKQIYCSKRCSRRSRRGAYGSCSLEDCLKPALWRDGPCNLHHKSQHPNRATWSKGSKETKRKRDRRRTQWRRAQVFDPAADQIDRDAVGDRDGWICGLCDQAIDRELAYPDPLSPSLDHVVPLSRGGKHVEANVQIAHLDCNVKRGNRLLEELAS